MKREQLLVEYPVLLPFRHGTGGKLDEFSRVLDTFIRFRDDIKRYIRPLDETTDVSGCPELKEVLGLAAKYRIFSLALPRSFGGQGCSMLALAMGLEQLSQGCAGIANLLATHGLALAVVGASGNLRWLGTLAERIIEDEKRGDAYLLSTAATEPSAGSDLEDFDTIEHAVVESVARQTSDGYELLGRKIYVSNGSIAKAHIVLVPLDRARPRETLTAFVVPKGQVGLHVVRTEKKLGQRASPAAELLLDGCRIPASMRLSEQSMAGRALDLVLGASRAVVGAFGAGIARGVYETCVSQLPEPARQHPLLGRLWQNARAARSSYVESNLVSSQSGLVSFTENELLRLADKFVPSGFVRSDVARQFMETKLFDEQAKRVMAKLGQKDIAWTSCFGSSTKITTSELALKNCELAFELLGANATRREVGIEKFWRDARLLPIYEGTNDLCLLDVAKKLNQIRKVHS
jgi:butyryl-CoA dehydrogenase